MDDKCEESIGRLIALTGQAIRSYADQRLKNYDLTLEQCQVLKEADIDDGLAQNQLSRLTGKSPANMTRILDRLEKKNSIVRKPNPEDRRSSLVYLTTDGQILKNEVTMFFEGLQAELVAGIAVEQQWIAIDVLGKIGKNIEKMSKK